MSARQWTTPWPRSALPKFAMPRGWLVGTDVPARFPCGSSSPPTKR